eukprot:TRINITY_DN16645_c0_g1_i1.p1 TRINITY_DN16645_c0_g1~~TRINITY_DN16645_c0_g1_i1.p1  ORF type:complete len:228 (-),score=58.33 TRINITY_DN16645_c0_g1_i1:244-897(-)
MGEGVAWNLLEGLSKENKKLHLWNRTTHKLDKFKENKHAIIEPSIATLCKNCNLIFSFAFDDENLKGFFGEVVRSARPGTTFVSCSTVHPDTIQALARESHSSGVAFLCAPVFGRPDAARAKAIVWVLAGPQKAKEGVRKYLQMTGRAVIDVGEEPRLAAVQKLVGNFTISALIELLGEAHVLAEKNGLSRESFQALIELLYPSPIIVGYTKRMLKE